MLHLSKLETVYNNQTVYNVRRHEFKIPMDFLDEYRNTKVKRYKFLYPRYFKIAEIDSLVKIEVDKFDIKNRFNLIVTLIPGNFNCFDFICDINIRSNYLKDIYVNQAACKYYKKKIKWAFHTLQKFTFDVDNKENGIVNNTYRMGFNPFYNCKNKDVQYDLYIACFTTLNVPLVDNVLRIPRLLFDDDRYATHIITSKDGYSMRIIAGYFTAHSVIFEKLLNNAYYNLMDLSYYSIEELLIIKEFIYVNTETKFAEPLFNESLDSLLWFLYTYRFDRLLMKCEQFIEEICYRYNISSFILFNTYDRFTEIPLAEVVNVPADPDSDTEDEDFEYNNKASPVGTEYEESDHIDHTDFSEEIVSDTSKSYGTDRTEEPEELEYSQESTQE